MQDGAVPLLIGVCYDKDTEERARHLSASALRNIGITGESFNHFPFCVLDDLLFF